MSSIDTQALTDAEHLIEMATETLVGEGVRPTEARIQARHLVDAEQRGHPSHGLRRLSTLVGRIRAGLISTSTSPTCRWITESSLVVDGANGLGPVVAYQAIDEVLQRVPSTGIAIAVISRAHHLGMLSPYLEHMTEQGVVGLMLSSTEGLVHPWGGAGALLGTNPLGIGVPAETGDLILDMSTAAVSAGKILDYAARGQALPSGWAVDKSGAPTTDARAAANGAISPFGGAKGYALGISLGALVGVLTGTSFGTEVRGTLDVEHDTTKGDVIIAIDPDLLGGPNSATRLGEYFGGIRNSGVGGVPVGIPGDRARQSKARASKEGIAMDYQLLDQLRTLHAEAGR